ncbi:hypothetical protein D3C76_648120 [compost metagenome]
MLKIVEQQVQLSFEVLYGVGDQGDQGVDRLFAAVAVEPVLIHCNAQALQGGQQIGQEAGELAVIEAERYPGHVQPGLHQFQAPLGEQNGFTEPGAASNQGCTAVLRFAQAVQQVCTGNVPGAQARRRELGGDQ